MVLRRGDRNDTVKGLQRGLNKFGSMLLVDGDFGAGTSTAVGSAREQLGRPGPSDVAEDDLQQAVAAAPDPCPPLTAAGVIFIAREQVCDAAARRLRRVAARIARARITVRLKADTTDDRSLFRWCPTSATPSKSSRITFR